MKQYATSIGLDVHARSIAACAFDPMTGEVTRASFPYDPAAVAEWALSFDTPRAVYESGVTGFHLCRALRALGLDCAVCVLSSLVEPPPSRICEPLPVTRRRAPDGVRHDEVSHSRHRNPSRSRHAAPPPMRAWRTRHDSPLNCTSLPWWTTLSITAAAIWSSPKTLPHMLNSRLVVNTTDWRS